MEQQYTSEYIDILRIIEKIEHYTTPIEKIPPLLISLCEKYQNKPIHKYQHQEHPYTTTLLDIIIFSKQTDIILYNLEIIKKYQLKSRNPLILFQIIDNTIFANNSNTYELLKYIINNHPLENLTYQTNTTKQAKTLTLSQYYKNTTIELEQIIGKYNIFHETTQKIHKLLVDTELKIKLIKNNK